MLVHVHRGQTGENRGLSAAAGLQSHLDDKNAVRWLTQLECCGESALLEAQLETVKWRTCYFCERAAGMPGTSLGSHEELAESLWVRITGKTGMADTVSLCYRSHDKEEVSETFSRQQEEASHSQTLVFARDLSLLHMY